jgi:hypothetical protein
VRSPLAEPAAKQKYSIPSTSLCPPFGIKIKRLCAPCLASIGFENGFVDSPLPQSSTLGTAHLECGGLPGRFGMDVNKAF